MAIHPLTSWRRYMRFNLSQLRDQGFAFDHFTARIGFTVDTSSIPERCHSEDDDVIGLPPDGDTFTFSILSNRGRLFTQTVNTKKDKGKTIDISITIPSNVKTLRLQVFRSSRKFALGPLCTAKIYAVWSETALSHGKPLDPACGSKCNIQGSQVYLSCLLGGCSGTALKAARPSKYAVIEKYHPRSEICVDCSSKRRQRLPVRFPGQRQIVQHLIGAQADSRIAFNLPQIRDLMDKRDPFNVLRMTVGIEQRAKRKCLNKLNETASSLSASRHMPLTFNVMLDGHHTFSVQHEARDPTHDVTLFIPQAVQSLRLEALAGSGHRLCSQAIWGEPRLEHNPLFDFGSCKRECGAEFNSGQYPLSCMFGRQACSGTLTYKGNDFATVKSAVGIDTAGGLAIQRHGNVFRRRIRFSGGRKSFRRGIGLPAPGEVSFNLHAMRESGLQFNFLHIIVGLDVNSLLPHCATYALRIGGEARIYGDGKLIRSWFLAHEHMGDSTQSGKRLPYYGSGFKVFLPVSNIKKLTFVSLNPFNSPCSTVSFGEAKLITLRQAS